MKDRFFVFALRFAKRKTKSQKNRFIKALAEIAGDLKYDAGVEVFTEERKEGRNFIVGDLKAASTVYICDYDTGDQIIEKNSRMYLLDDLTNVGLFTRNRVNFIIASVVLLVAAVGLFISSFGFSGNNRWIAIVASVVLLIMSAFTFKGLASKYTFKASSAIFLMFELMARFRGKKRCFVFADRSVYSGGGRRAFFEKNDLKGKKIIHLTSNCAPGETACVYSDNCSETTVKKIERCPEFTVSKAEPFSFPGEIDFELLMIGQYLFDEDGRPYVDNFSTSGDIVFEQEAYEKTKAAVIALDTRL